MAAVLNTETRILTETRDGWRVVIDTTHSLVATAISMGVPVTEMPWLDEALGTLAKVQAEVGCDEELALEILNAGGSWAFLERDN